MRTRRTRKLIRRKGFTFVEIIIVAIVVGILAATGVAQYNNFVERARKNTCIDHQSQIVNAVQLIEKTDVNYKKQRFFTLDSSGTILANYKNPTLDNNLGRSPVTGDDDPAHTGTASEGGIPAPFLAGSKSVRRQVQDEMIFMCPEDLKRNSNVAYQTPPDVTLTDRATPVPAQLDSFGGASTYVYSNYFYGQPMSYNLRTADQLRREVLAFCRRWGRVSTPSGDNPNSPTLRNHDLHTRFEMGEDF